MSHISPSLSYTSYLSTGIQYRTKQNYKSDTYWGFVHRIFPIKQDYDDNHKLIQTLSSPNSEKIYTNACMNIISNYQRKPNE